MSKPLRWPNNMRNHRDRSAEEIQTAIQQTQKLLREVQEGAYTRQGLEIGLLSILKRQLIAIRHLEAAGAETVPE